MKNNQEVIKRYLEGTKIGNLDVVLSNNNTLIVYDITNNSYNEYIEVKNGIN